MTVRYRTEDFFSTDFRLWIGSVRLEKSCELLEQTGKCITEVAFEVGFNDGNYFTRQFGKAHGMSPRAYRHKYREATRI